MALTAQGGEMYLSTDGALSDASTILLRTFKDHDWRRQSRPREGFAKYLGWAEDKGFRFEGEEMEYRVWTKDYTGVRFGGSELSALPPPQATDGAIFTVGVSDLRQIGASIQHSEQMKRLSATKRGAIVAWVAKTESEVKRDLREAKARKFWQNYNARLFTVDGTPTDNANGRAKGNSASSDLTIQFPVKNTAMGWLRKGMTIAIYTGGTADHGIYGATNAEGVEIVDIFRYEDSTAYTGTDTTGERWIVRIQSAAALDTVADGDDAYLAIDHSTTAFSEKGYGLYGPQTWFRLTAGGGYDTLFNVNRTTAGNDWARPIIFREGGTNTTFEWDSHMKPYAAAIAHMRGDANDDFVLCACPELVETVTGDLADSGYHPIPTADAKMPKLIGHYGFDGAVFHHPTIGKFGIEPDRMCPDTGMYFLQPSTWFFMNLGEIDFLPGPHMGIWHQVQDTGVSYAAYRASMVGWMQIGNQFPQGNFLIDAVKADHA